MGGLGQTGVIASAELQLMRCKGDIVTVTERRATGFDDFLSLLDASEATYTVGWIDATARGDRLGRGILEEAETGAGLVPPAKPSKSVPFNAPGFALSPPVVRAFNAAYFRRVPAQGPHGRQTDHRVLLSARPHPRLEPALRQDRLSSVPVRRPGRAGPRPERDADPHRGVRPRLAAGGAETHGTGPRGVS